VCVLWDRLKNSSGLLHELSYVYKSPLKELTSWQWKCTICSKKQINT